MPGVKFEFVPSFSSLPLPQCSAVHARMDRLWGDIVAHRRRCCSTENIEETKPPPQPHFYIFLKNVVMLLDSDFAIKKPCSPSKQWAAKRMSRQFLGKISHVVQLCSEEGILAPEGRGGGVQEEEETEMTSAVLQGLSKKVRTVKKKSITWTLPIWRTSSSRMVPTTLAKILQKVYYFFPNIIWHLSHPNILLLTHFYHPFLSQHGNTALHECSWKGFSRSASFLCRSRANPYIKNRGGFAPLHLCCQNGHNETCRVLLLSGCKPDIKNNVSCTRSGGTWKPLRKKHQEQCST